MNSILQDKIIALENANDYECWYLVKQPTEFDNICYLVSFLKEFKSNEISKNLQDFIGKKVNEINGRKPEVSISNNYRALRVAAFFGLITMVSTKYEDAVITETFEEINKRCAGEFERKDLYVDIIQRQIEKMYISSIVDEEHNGVRENFRLYPIMLLYKILIELGRATGDYSITMTEYRYLVATTEKFENFLDTLLLIKLLRNDITANSEFEKYRTKFDNRLILALKQLPTLIVDKDSIRLNQETITEVSKKVFMFEKKPDIFITDNYLSFLGSKKSLFELDEFEKENTIKKDIDIPRVDLDEASRIKDGTNVLLYGVPGSGKSWTIEHEYCKKGNVVERVVFHPDYTHSDFIGQILPDVSENGQVTYKFTPGPFTNILAEAYTHPLEEYILIIEEINRGNAPAIFGEIFQLLDRKTEIRSNDDGYPIGTSEYGITNVNIARIVYGDEKHKVRIPSNLSIIATMNTSDQNVFTLDTAFQRRWNMRLIENDFMTVDPKFADAEILDTTVTWKDFCIEINKKVITSNTGFTSSEDKRLGVYFVHLGDLEYSDDRVDWDEYDKLCKKESEGLLNSNEENKIKKIRQNIKQIRKFPEKVIKYLWDDAFKFNREIIFETAEYQTLEQVIKAFLNAEGIERFKVFNTNVKELFVKDTEE